MRRILLFTSLALLGLVSYFIIVTYQDTYRILPGDVTEPAAINPYRQWRLFTPEDGAFAALLPVMPNMTQDSVTDNATGEIRKYDIYVAEKNNGTIFIINLINYPDRSSLDTQTLTEVKQELLRLLPQSTLRSEDSGSFAGHEAVEVEVDNPMARLKGKAFIVENTLYLITYMTDQQYFDEEEYAYFLDSFRVYKGQQLGQ